MEQEAGHSVTMPFPTINVLHRGRCRCGWTVHFDPASYDAACDRAAAHCADALQAYPAGGNG